MTVRVPFAGLVFIIAAACSSPDEAAVTDTVTSSERDSVLAESGLPGARGVGAAMRAADSAKARAARLDSLANDP